MGSSPNYAMHVCLLHSVMHSPGKQALYLWYEYINIFFLLLSSTMNFKICILQEIDISGVYTFLTALKQRLMSTEENQIIQLVFPDWLRIMFIQTQSFRYNERFIPLLGKAGLIPTLKSSENAEVKTHYSLVMYTSSWIRPRCDEWPSVVKWHWHLYRPHILPRTRLCDQ